MNYSKYRFNLDTQSYVSQVSIPIRQHDTGIVLRINLTDGGVPYIIEDGSRAVFCAKKSDGKPLLNDCIIEQNSTILYELTQQTTACPGVVDCEIRVYGPSTILENGDTVTGDLLTSPRFILVVDSRVVRDEDFPLSEEDQTVLDNIILSEQDRVKAEEEREKASAEALAKAEQAEELVDELIERLKVEDIGDEELRIHNENAEAHSKAFEAHNADLNAHSEIFGEGNVRGLKGYWVEAVSTSNNKLRLSTTTDRASVGAPTLAASITEDGKTDTGYAVGDEFSIITPKNHHILCGKITAIQNNLITYELYPEAQAITWSAGAPLDNNDYSFVVPAKPDVGVATISEGGVAEGYYTRAGGDWSHSEGVGSQAIGSYSHAEGLNTFSGYSAHAEGEGTKAIGKYAHAEGFETEATGNDAAHSEGFRTLSTGYGSHAEGRYSKATANAAHAEGYETKATNNYAHAEGYRTKATHECAHAEGCGSIASGKYAHAEGYDTNAQGANSHSEGYNTFATESCGHAEGYSTNATGKYAHSEGKNTLAQGEASHAEGKETKASGAFSHSEGCYTEASGAYSHAGGYKTVASGEAQTVIGKWSKINPEALFIVGNGTKESARSNAFEVLKDGTILTPYGSPMHMVSGSYIGTASKNYSDPVDLTFDVLPDILFMTSPQKIIFPKVNSDPDVIVKNNTITLKTANNIYNIVSTVYHYLAFYSTTPIVQDEKGVSFTVRRVDTGGNVYNDPGPEEFLVEQGTTWREFLEGIRRTDGQYGVGTTTGRVYWKVYDAYEHGPARSAYLRDSNGNYVLGTDVIKEETYTSWYVFNGEYGVTPPLT